MKILLIVANFIPEIGAAAHIYHDLGKAFVQRGHEVDVITSYPREYNLIQSDKSIQFPLEETIDGIKVHRCWHPALRDNIIFRGLEHFFLIHYYFKEYRKIGKKFDVCLMYIPPLPLYYLAKKIKKFDGTPSILNFMDFHPQELTDVGVLKNPIIIKILEYIERKAYQNADFITVSSAGGIEYITQRGGNPEKIMHIFNGAILSDIDTLFTKKDFKQRQKISEKYLITYAGIFSPFQGLDRILDAAKGLREHEDIVFYMVGDGMSKKHLERRIKEEHIENVYLLPLQPRDEFFNIVNSSDLCLISLDERMKAPCFPGKTLNLLAARKPIIAITDASSETARIITDAGCGEVIEPDDTAKLQNAILRLYLSQQQGEIYGLKGRDFFKANMELEKSVQSYEQIVAQIMNDCSKQVT
jgi:glycosyltransferase involved in cell wall biosynthesis